MSLYRCTIPLQVRYTAGAYNTTRVRGMSASSTSGAEEAVRRLAGKLAQHGFGPAKPVIRLLEQAPGLATIAGCGTWVIEEAPPAATRDCRKCVSRCWSGCGQAYDCNAAAGTPLPHDHHDGVVPNWCPLAAAATATSTQGA
jgi:hypothetical protein